MTNHPEPRSDQPSETKKELTIHNQEITNYLNQERIDHPETRNNQPFRTKKNPTIQNQERTNQSEPRNKQPLKMKEQLTI